MDRNRDIERLEDPPSSLSLKTGENDVESRVRRQRNSVPNVQAAEGSDTEPPRPKDYTFRGRHVEMIAIGI